MKDLTICIPVYKRLEYLKVLVESVPEDYPVCVSDNGNYVKDDFFCRGNIRIKHLENVVPMFSNWNQVIDMVETSWFMIPGDDDLIYPEKLDVIMKSIEDNPDCGILAFGYNIINENNEKHNGWCPRKTIKYEAADAFTHIQRTIPYRCPAIVVNTEKSRSIGNYDEDFVFTASDSLYLQHMAILYPIAEISEIVAGYRMWENNFTNTKCVTKEWFDQLELWMEKLSNLLKKMQTEAFNVKGLHDLVIYDNLMHALSIMPDNMGKYKLLLSVGWPLRIGVVNHLRLLKRLLLSKKSVL